MFGLFNKSLSSYQAPSIQAVLFAQATRHLNKTLAEEADSLGRPSLFQEIDHGEYLKLLELYYSYLFGRMIARLSDEGRDIPQPPDLIGKAHRMRDAIVSLLAWSDDPLFFQLKSNSIGKKALEIGSAMSRGMGYTVSTAFKLHFGVCLEVCGYPEKSIEHIRKRYSVNLDSVINEICQGAEKFWNSIPRRQKDSALEELAATAQSTVVEINTNSHFGALLQRV